MLYPVFTAAAPTLLAPAAILFAFVLCSIALQLLKGILPVDGGRKFAFNGKLTAGRPRGAGLLIVAAFVITAVLFVPLKPENLVYLLMVVAAMLSGYLDDRSETPWNEYKKGAIDLAICESPELLEVLM